MLIAAMDGINAKRARCHGVGTRITCGELCADFLMAFLPDYVDAPDHQPVHPEPFDKLRTGSVEGFAEASTGSARTGARLSEASTSSGKNIKKKLSPLRQHALCHGVAVRSSGFSPPQVQGIAHKGVAN